MAKKIPGILILYFFFSSNIFVLAQAAEEEKAITGVINRLFEGMTRSDTAMIHATFASGATLATISRKNDEVKLKRDESVDGFLKAIARLHTEVYYEEIWNLKISIDGDF